MAAPPTITVFSWAVAVKEIIAEAKAKMKIFFMVKMFLYTYET
jgi:hypothetical protein